MQKPSMRWAFSFPYYLSISSGAKLKCTFSGNKISFVMRVIARFPRLWRLDSIFGGWRFSRGQRLERPAARINIGGRKSSIDVTYGTRYLASRR
jgi:hypothetical protein